jgi:hypothetical protein
MPTAGTNENGSYVQYDGSVNVGGSRSWRDNNPGNMEAGPFPDAHGAIGTDGRFAIFPDSATGMRALVSLLSSDSYQGLTVEEAMERYAPPSENNTNAYTSFITNNVGVDPSTPMSDLSPDQLNSFANAIQTYEGNIPGTTYQDGDADARAGCKTFLITLAPMIQTPRLTPRRAPHPTRCRTQHPSPFRYQIPSPIHRAIRFPCHCPVLSRIPTRIRPSRHRPIRHHPIRHPSPHPNPHLIQVGTVRPTLAAVMMGVAAVEGVMREAGVEEAGMVAEAVVEATETNRFLRTTGPVPLSHDLETVQRIHCSNVV